MKKKKNADVPLLHLVDATASIVSCTPTNSHVWLAHSLTVSLVLISYLFRLSTHCPLHQHTPLSDFGFSDSIRAFPNSNDRHKRCQHCPELIGLTCRPSGFWSLPDFSTGQSTPESWGIPRNIECHLDWVVYQKIWHRCNHWVIICNKYNQKWVIQSSHYNRCQNSKQLHSALNASMRLSFSLHECIQC